MMTNTSPMTKIRDCDHTAILSVFSCQKSRHDIWWKTEAEDIRAKGEVDARKSDRSISEYLFRYVTHDAMNDVNIEHTWLYVYRAWQLTSLGDTISVWEEIMPGVYARRHIQRDGSASGATGLAWAGSDTATCDLHSYQ